MPKIVVIGGGNVSLALSVALSTMDSVMLVDAPEPLPNDIHRDNVFELTAPAKYPCEAVIANTPDYGWYRKFEKPNKRRNFTKK